eukprot:3131238-Pyramimonas_sp.AAC.1
MTGRREYTVKQSNGIVRALMGGIVWRHASSLVTNLRTITRGGRFAALGGRFAARGGRFTARGGRFAARWDRFAVRGGRFA